MKTTTTWRKELNDALRRTGDLLVACSLTDEELDTEFDDGFGAAEGKSFWCWGTKFVYFSVVYDGAESVGYVPREPTTAISPGCEFSSDRNPALEPIHWGGE